MLTRDETRQRGLSREHSRYMLCQGVGNARRRGGGGQLSAFPLSADSKINTITAAYSFLYNLPHSLICSFATTLPIHSSTPNQNEGPVILHACTSSPINSEARHSIRGRAHFYLNTACMGWARDRPLS